MPETNATTGADQNFGNAETIPATPVYIANFAGDEIDGVVYGLGDTIPKEGKPMPDPGTIRFLVQNGRITEKAAGDGTAQSGGTTEATNPAGIALSIVKPTAAMDRMALLVELASGMSDDDLRDAVERKRAEAGRLPGEFDADAFVDRNLLEISDEQLRALSPGQLAEVREAEVAGRGRSTLLTRIDAIAPPPPSGGLTADEEAARDKLVADNDEEALRALADEEKVEGVKTDTDKAEIATLIVLGRRKA